MNKLLLNSEDTINNLIIEDDTDLALHTNDTTKEINLIVDSNICLNIIDISINSKTKTVITLKENASLIYNKAFSNCDEFLEVNLDGELSNVIINTSCLNTEKTKYHCIVRHNNKNTTSKLVNHGVNKSSDELLFKVDAVISYNGSQSKTSQENKIINLKSGKSDILPNLIVDNEDVEASHSAYISDFNEEEIFYMKTRGIAEKDAKKLLIRAFLIGNLEHIQEYENEIEAILN